MTYNRPIGERFQEKVYKLPGKNSCWLWLGTIDNTTGYGKFFVGNGKSVGAHRFAWFLRYHAWPKNNACHKCDVRHCVRPSHLFDGTDQENVDDMTAKNRGNYTTGLRRMLKQNRGETNGNAKLSEIEVRLIKRILRAKTTPKKEIARMFNVDASTISDIVAKRTWKHIP